MIRRPHLQARAVDLLSRFPVVALLGPRQVGKTTLARQMAADYEGKATFFDLESPADRARLQEPQLALELRVA